METVRLFIRKTASVMQLFYYKETAVVCLRQGWEICGPTDVAGQQPLSFS